MKFGVRKPSIKRSIKARTTGRAKRAVKRSINPLYGKKGMGLVKNPKKAVYNKVYKKTSIGAVDIAKKVTASKKDSAKKATASKKDRVQNNKKPRTPNPSLKDESVPNQKKQKWTGKTFALMILSIAIGFVAVFAALFTLVGFSQDGLTGLVIFFGLVSALLIYITIKVAMRAQKEHVGY